MIREKMGSDDDDDGDISACDLRVSLQCPISKTRITKPCRPATCKHIQVGVYLFVRSFARLVCPFVPPFVGLSVSLAVPLSVCLLVPLSVHLSVRLSVFLYLTSMAATDRLIGWSETVFHLSRVDCMRLLCPLSVCSLAHSVRSLVLFVRLPVRFLSVRSFLVCPFDSCLSVRFLFVRSFLVFRLSPA